MSVCLNHNDAEIIQLTQELNLRRDNNSPLTPAVVAAKVNSILNAKKGTSNISIANKNFNRAEVEKDISSLYVFTDNTNRTSGNNKVSKDSWYAKKYGENAKYPTITTALLRGLENAFPISTQRWYDIKKGLTKTRGRWNDVDITEFKKVIDDEIEEIKRAWDSGKYKRIIFPKGDGFFNSSISAINEQRTPELYSYLKNKIDELESYTKDEIKMPTTDEVETYINNTSFEENTKRAERINKLKNIKEQVIKDYPDPFIRKQRVSMVVRMFKDMLDSLQEEYPTLSRIEIINTVSPTFINDQVKEMISYYRDNSDEKTALEFDKLLNNFDALMNLGAPQILLMEGLKLDSNKVSKGVMSSEDEEGNSDTSVEEGDLVSVEERILDGWQFNFREVSASDSMSLEVRTILADIPELDFNGEPVTVDFGTQKFPVFIDPDYAHNALMERLRFMTSVNDMNKLMSEMSTHKPWLNAVIEQLKNNETLRTKFYVDFRKDFVLYSIQRASVSSKDARHYYKTVEINHPQGIGFLLEEWKDNYLNGRVLSDKSVYNKNGFLNIEKVRDNLIEVNNLLNVFNSISWPSQKNEEGLSLSNTLNEQFIKENITQLSSLMKSIGIDFSDELLEKALNKKEIGFSGLELESKGNVSSVLKNLKLIYEGLTKESNVTYKDPETGELFKALKGEEVRVEFANLFKKSYIEFGELFKPFTDDAIESSVFENGKSYYSHVNPSYLGKMIKTLKNEAGLKSDAEMEALYQKEFKDSFWFFKNGKYRNEWLRELTSSKSARDLLQHKVLLHFDRVNYAQMDDLQYSLALINEYFTDPNENSAWYAIPVLSDSPSGEFLKFKRYSKNYINDETGETVEMYDNYTLPDGKQIVYNTFITDKFVDIALQELDRIKITQERKKLIAKNKTKAITSLDKHGDKFHFLPALNEHLDIINEMVKKGQNVELVDLIRDTIIKDVDAKFKEFIEAKKEQGVLETLEDSNVLKVLNIDKGSTFIENNGEYFGTVIPKLRDYFWNSMFASSQIIQITNVDIAQFKGIEDFYKRNKQIHAPSTRLDISATYNGELVGKEMETTIYLEDNEMHSLQEYRNTLEHALDLREKAGTITRREKLSILSNYGQFNNKSFIVKGKNNTNYRYIHYIDNEGKDRGYVAYNIKKREYIDINKESYDTALEATKAREEESLQDLEVKGKFEFYITKKINQTDGQSYRTLDSYRRLMVMSGQWSEQYEQAYNRLKDGTWSLADYNVIMQPQKTYLYTHATVDTKVALQKGQESSKYKLGVQHKHAEVLLLPFGKLAESSKFAGIMQFMDDNQHDRLSFNSVVKVGEQGAINLNNVSSLNDVYNYLNQATKVNGVNNPEVVHSTFFEDYGIQQKVPEHGIDADSLFGTQIRKLITSDLPDTIKLTSNGVTRTKAQWLSHYKALITENIISSFELAEVKFSSKEELSKILQEEVKGNKRYGNDVLTAIQLDEEGNFNIPIHEPSQANRIQQLLHAIIKNRVTKQKINGGSIVNMSNYGFTDELQIKINSKTGAIEYMEAYMPITSAKFIEPLLEADGTININKKNANGEFIYPEDMRKLIGYRIPTEDKYSMFPIKIKGFLPQTMGGVIMLPAEITTIAGLDFDVDKLYMMMPNSKVVNNTIQKVNYKTTAEFEDYASYIHKNSKSSESAAIKLTNKEAKKELIAVLQHSKQVFNDELSEGYKQQVNEFKQNLKESELVAQITELNSKRRDALMDLSDDLRNEFSNLKAQLDNNSIKGAAKATENLNATLEMLNRKGISSEDKETLKYLATLHELELQAYGIKDATIKEFIEDLKELVKLNKNQFFLLKTEAFEKLLHASIESLRKENNLLTFDEFKKEFSRNHEQYNSKEAIDNQMIDLMWSVLTSPEMIHKMTKPGGFENAKTNSRIIVLLQNANQELMDLAVQNGFVSNSKVDLIGYLESLSFNDLDNLMAKYKPKLDILSPTTLVKVHSQYAAAGSMISIAATNNANHALLQHTNIRLNDLFTFSLDGKRYRLLHKITSEEVHTQDGFKETGEGIYITNSNAEILASSVDAVKDPVLNYLNANPITSSTLFLLNRLGYDPKVIALLLNQPIVLQATKEAFSAKRAGIRFKQIIDKHKQQLLVDLNIMPNEKSYSQFNYSKEDLAAMIILGNKIKAGEASEIEVREFLEYQQKVAGLISHILDSAEPLQDETNAIRADTPKGGGGPTIGHSLNKLKAVEEYLKLAKKHPGALKPTKRNSSPFVNGDFINLDYNTDPEEFRKKYKGTPLYEIQAFLTYGLASTNKLFSPYTPYFNPVFSTVRAILSSYTKNGKLNPKTIDAIHNDLYVYIMNKTQYLGGKTNNEKDSLEYFANNFPNDFEEIINKFAQHPDIVKNQFIKSLNVLKPSVKVPYTRIVFKEVGKLKTFRREVVMEDWNALLYSEQPELQQLALDLFKYATVRNGFAFGPHSFIHLATTEIKKAIPGYIEELQNMINMNANEFDVTDSMNSFMFSRQFILNHPEIKSLYTYIPDNSAFTDIVNEEKVLLDNITIPINENGEHPSKYDDFFGENEFPAEFVGTKLGLSDYIYTLTETNEDSYVYTKQEWLGLKNEFVQYEYGKDITTMHNWLKPVAVKTKQSAVIEDAEIDYSTMREDIGTTGLTESDYVPPKDKQYVPVTTLIQTNNNNEEDVLSKETTDFLNSVLSFNDTIKDDNDETICPF